MFLNLKGVNFWKLVMENSIKQLFIEKILSGDFSCIGAKASIKNVSYEFCLLEEMASLQSTHDLYKSLKIFTKKRPMLDKRFASFIVCFKNSAEMTLQQFEYLLWKQLYMLHQKDDFAWDKSVSNDLNNPHFSFSIAGEAYFVVGMCYNHPRKCRNFPYPILVFNSHHQFQYLKKINLFEKIKKIIRLRELKFTGSIHPNVVDFGDMSEALQYSGLQVSKNWTCPFRFDVKGVNDGY
jgi:FPC/CPF motif-containing protein YcgG